MIPEKPAADFIRGWELVFGKDQAQTKSESGTSIQLRFIAH